LSAHASINGNFYSEFKRNNMECAIEANISQSNINKITFKQWNELCEDAQGNSYESSLEDKMTYEKTADAKLKVTQGKETIILEAKILDFKKDYVHYDFEVDTEDGHLEINESYTLVSDVLTYSSVYLLDGKEIINKSGTVKRK
jgi:hypothetical protein